MPFDVRAYVENNIENLKSSTGDELCGTCPFCGKDGRFYVNAESGRWICFKCENAGKSIAGVIAQIEDITYERANALMMRQSVQFKRKMTPATLLARIRAVRPSAMTPEPEAQVDFPLPEEFRPVFNGKVWKFPTYLKARGIARETAKAWGMGFCNNGRFGGRVIIPVKCPNGNSYTGRTVHKDVDPRYLNPKGADHGRLFCGWNMVKHKGSIVLVEGPLDAVKMWQHGIPAIAMMGKVLHPEQFEMLRAAYPPDSEITIMTDPEEIKAPRKIAKRLLIRYDRVYIAKLPEGVDPGSSTKKQAQKAMDLAERTHGELGAGMSELVEATKKSLTRIYQ